MDLFTSNLVLSKELMNQAVDDQVQARINELTRVVQANSDLLDTVTQHGLTTETRDPNFFNRLYMEQNLADQEFSSLDEMQLLLKSRRYRVHAKVDGEESN